MRCSPYVEWYQNSIAIEGSPAALHHAEVHGNRPYDDFVETFLDGHAGWQAEPWADLFQAAGARYVVLVTKHHDGVLLWPSATPNPHKPRWGSDRDLVGDLAAAVRARDLRFGTYYSGGLDWSFGGLPMRDFQEMLGGHPADRRVRRLRRRPLARAHRPLPARRAVGRHRLPGGRRPAGAVRALLRGGARRRDQQPLRLDGPVGRRRCTATSSRPSTPPRATPNRKWETTRGIGTSFGYNRAGGRVELPVTRRAGADVRRHRRPRRQPAPQRRSQRRRHHPVRAGAAPARARLVAPHQRRRHVPSVRVHGRVP